MIILSWNCRGLGHPAAVPFLCGLVNARRPDVIFLSETLSHSTRIEGIRTRLSYDSVNCVGRSGGLCVLWKSTAVCSILTYSQHHIDLSVTEEGGNWRLTGFYGCPEGSRRRESWALLR